MNTPIDRKIQEYTLGCAVWELTLECNLRCFHCGSSAGKARLDELTTKEAIRLCTELAEIGCRGVALMGGEPFLREDWFIIAKKIHDLNMKLSIISNGFIMDQEIVSKLVELQPDSVGISLDGAHAETHDRIRGVKGSFKAASKALSLLRRAGLPTSVITTVHKLNLKEMPAIRDLLLGKGIAWQIQHAVPFGRFTEKFMLSEEEFYSVAMFIASTQKKYSTKEMPVIGAHDFGYHSHFLPRIQLQPWQGCQAGITVLGIQSNGNVKGCLTLPDEFIEGNIRDRSLIEVWRDIKSFKYTRHFTPENLKGFCGSCKYGNGCRGGCSNISHALTGRLHSNPYCFYRIEHRLFSKELKSPLKRLFWKLSKYGKMTPEITFKGKRKL